MKYLLIALSLLFIGSIADVPVMYLAVQGTIPLLFVVIAGFFADILPDFLWYWIGGHIGVERLCKIPFFRQKPERLEAVGRTLDRFGAYLLFASKFMYAFGIPSQIMAGAHRFPLKKAFAANALGSLGWLVLLYGLAHIFSIDAVEDYLRNGKIALTLFIGSGILIYFGIGRLLQHFFPER